LWSKFKYLTGLKIYDLLSGKFSFGRSKALSKTQIKKLLPGISTDKLTGGIEYFDGQFDDARLAINLAQTSVEKGAIVLNYFKVTSLLKENKKICGITAVETETCKQYSFQAKVVINATGVFVDDILKMDRPERNLLVKPSQGIHLVFDKRFLNSNSAMMIPKTSDGRVLFAIPWHDHILAGTTDTPLDKNSIEPKPLQEEIEFIIDTLKQYLKDPPEEKNILSLFAGLRPLAVPQKNTGNTKEIARDHKLIISDAGLVTITGGKWTTYRKMAEETIDKAVRIGNLKLVSCPTKKLKIHGCTDFHSVSHLSVYGSDEEKINQLIKQDRSLEEKLSDTLPYTIAAVVWAVRYEMARTIEDVLARRIRILFLDKRAAIKAAPKVAGIIAQELNYSNDWVRSQVNDFTKLAEGYLPE
jgi:glycerol-3-phosphate dehydrogenase